MTYDVRYRLRNIAGRVLQGPVDGFGEQALFYGETVRYVPNAVTRYRKETTRLIAEMTMGAGALVMIGGTVGVAAFLTLASGGVIAVQGYASLGNIGIEALTGFLSAFLNVRVVAPVIAGIALRQPSVPALPPNWARCAYPRRSTPSNAWPCTRCPTWCRPAW